MAANQVGLILPVVDRLTERQKTYIKKLGASSGRDIVPIDLTLYRELMSLELIVDKGRRLALSGLGKEVYKGLTIEFHARPQQESVTF